MAERRLTDYFTNFVEAHQDEYQICKQEQINLFAALLFTYKYRMVEAREKLIAAFFARLDSSVLDDLVSEALKYILPCLRSTEDFDALTRVLYHLEKAEWIQFAACDYQTSAYERTSVILTNLVSLGSYARV